MKVYNGVNVSIMTVDEVNYLCKSVRPLFAGIIYCYTNTINGFKYIGQTRNPKERYKAHLKASKEGLRECNMPFHAALRKYGIENFKYSVLDFIIADYDVELKVLLNAYEIVNIHENKSTVDKFGYNINVGGAIVGVGELHPNSKPIEEYDLNTMAKSAEYPSLMEAGKAHGISDSTVRNICKHKSFKHKHYVFCYKGEEPVFIDPHQATKKYFHQYDLNGNHLAKFDSLKAAQEATGVNPSCISTACNSGNGTHKAGNYLWYNYRHSSCPPYKGEGPKYFLYSGDGDYVTSFVQKKEIAEYVNVKGVAQINTAIDSPTHKIKGYYLRSYKCERITDMKEVPFEQTYPGAKRISCYDCKGRIVNTFKSKREAADWVKGKSTSGVSNAILKPYKLYRGCYWREGDTSVIKIVAAPTPPDKYQVFEVETHALVGTFYSKRNIAENLGINYSGVQSCLSGAQKTTRGYYIKELAK